MNDRTAMVVTVVGNSVGMGAVLLTVVALLIGSVNTRSDDLQGTVNTRIGDTNTRISDVVAVGNRVAPVPPLRSVRAR